MDSDPQVSTFIEGESTRLPKFYENKIRKSLGPLWEMLPAGALMHDQNAYLNSQAARSEEHTSELQSLMRISYAVFCLKKKNHKKANKPLTPHLLSPPHNHNNI